MQKAVYLVTGSPCANHETVSTLQEAIDIAWATGAHIHQGPLKYIGTKRTHETVGYCVCKGDCIQADYLSRGYAVAYKD